MDICYPIWMYWVVFTESPDNTSQVLIGLRTITTWTERNPVLCIRDFRMVVVQSAGDTRISLDCKNMLCSLPNCKSCQCVAQHFLKICILPYSRLWNTACPLLLVARLGSHVWMAILSIISVIRKIWHIGPYTNVFVVSFKQTINKR